MSGSNKSYLPSQRMMPVYTTVSPPQTERNSVPEFPYDPVPSKTLSSLSKSTSYGLSLEENSSQSKSAVFAMAPGESPKQVASYSRVQEFPYDPPDKSKPPDYPYDDLPNGGKSGQPSAAAYSRGEDKTSPPSLALAYPRMQDFPYGLSGVAMPSYNYSSELYSYVSNGFPRKSRMCSYCGKVFTRSTTRRYHEKRCPLLRAAGSLLKNETQVAAAAAAVKTETSPSYASANTSHTTVSSSQHTSFALASLSSQPYASTSTAAVDQNRNAVSGIKGEPHEMLDPSPSNSESFSQGDLSTPRYTPDFDSANQQVLMFSPPMKDRSSESPLSLQTDNQTASDHQDTGEPLVFKDNMDHSTASDLGAGSTDALYSNSNAGYQQYKDIQVSRQSSYHSGIATSSYNNTVSQGTSGDGSSFNQDMAQENDNMCDSKSEERTPKSVLANKCSICGKTFDSPRQLHIHEQLHTKYKPYACRFCGQRFLKVSMRIAHERLHIGEKPYVCAICGLTFTRKYSVRLHMRRRHTDGPCLCRYCGKTLYTLQTLKSHLLSHNLPKSEKESLHYLGTSGGERIADASGAKEDDENAVVPTTPEDQLAQSNKDLALAMELELGGNSKEKEWCKLCEKEFPKSFMRYHEKLHADQKPYECPTCNKRFGYKNNMKSHMKLHAGIKPYQCHVCGAKFTRGSTLRRHARRHGIFTESVWDFFVQKGASSGKQNNVSKQKGPVGPLKVQTQGQGQSSPEISSSRSTQGETTRASVTPDKSVNYERGAYSGPPALTTSTMYPGYAAVATLPESIYHTYPSTSHFNVNYSNYTASQEPQADALNLSVTKDAMEAAAAAAVAAADIAETSEDEAEGSESKSNISSHTCTSGGASVGVQVNLCGCTDKTSLLATLPFDHRLLSPLNIDGSGTTATSPSLSSGGENFNQESVSTLMSSGRLFRCSHCDCYFSEYAMYRIHQKLHARDANRPFLCPVCFEDCHDKMYYALHLYEHLRM
ncbi:uncharacterized protein [Haliotis cracherodii]|uniref:uncharacterized protein n=1 Tax=Haliotis cracherodii TaxID=6455 RepID=UPI0039EA5C58